MFRIVFLLLVPTSVLTQNVTNTFDPYNPADVALLTISQHLTYYTSVIAIAERSTNSATFDVSRNMLNHLLHNLKETMTVQLGFVGQIYKYNLLIVDSLEALRIALEGILITVEDGPFHFLVILTSKSSNWNYIMQDLFNDFLIHNVINVNIIVKPSHDVYMYTYTLFLKNRCLLATPIILSSSETGWQHLNDLFPEKLKNFNQCPVRISARNFEPFFKFVGNKSDPKPVGNWENMFGFEGNLLKYLARSLNFSIILLPFVEEFSYVDRNGGHGNYALLSNGMADIAIGCLSVGEQIQTFYSQSMIYYKSRLQHVVRTKNISSLERLKKPLNSQFWIILILFYIFGFIFLFGLKFTKRSIRHFILGNQNKSSFTNFLALIAGNPVTGLPQRNFARFILMMLLILNFIIRTVYLASLFEVIQNNKTLATPPSEFNQLLEENYIFLLPPGIQNMNIHPKNKIITVKQSFAKRMEILENSDGNYASVTLYHCFVYFSLEAEKLKKENNLILIKEIFVMYQMAMSFAKRSIFHDVISKKLENFNQVGILSKLKKQLRDAEDHSKSLLTLEKVKLTVRHLRGVFDILLYMECLALGVFGLELLSKRFPSVRKAFESIG